MADVRVHDTEESILFTSQIIKRRDESCERCKVLKNRLHSAQKELKTAKLIIDLLLEDVKTPTEADINPNTK